MALLPIALMFSVQLALSISVLAVTSPSTYQWACPILIALFVALNSLHVLLAIVDVSTRYHAARQQR